MPGENIISIAHFAFIDFSCSDLQSVPPVKDGKTLNFNHLTSCFGQKNAT